MNRERLGAVKARLLPNQRPGMKIPQSGVVRYRGTTSRWSWSVSIGLIPETCTCPSCSTRVGSRAFVRKQRGARIASTALVEPMTDAFVAEGSKAIAKRAVIPWWSFAKGSGRTTWPRSIWPNSRDGGRAVHWRGAGEGACAADGAAAAGQEEERYPYVVETTAYVTLLCLCRRCRGGSILPQVLIHTSRTMGGCV